MFRATVFIALSALLFAGCDKLSSDEQKAQSKPQPPAVTVAKPLKQLITEWDEFTGRFEAVETVNIQSRVSGTLSKIHFTDGEIVRKNDLLFTIDKRPFEIAVQQAKASMEETKAGLELAESDVSRAKPLLNKGNLSRSEYDTRVARKLQAQARLGVAEAQLRQARLNLEWTEVKAPISGRISDSRIDVGNLISGGQANATLLTKIVSLDQIHFTFFGSETDFLKYTRLATTGKRPSSREAPNPVKVRLADETVYKHSGQMDFIDNELDPNSGTIRARAVFDNRSLLLTPGLFGRLRLYGGKTEALLIPDTAISSNQANKVVLTVDKGGTVGAKVITVGPIIDGLRVVRSGLTDKDTIIINGLQRARPGQKVTPEPGKITVKEDKSQTIKQTIN